MELTLNGEHVTVEPREDEQLLELLRERFGLCSVKDGCAPEGSCGACTVIVDGQAVVSCAQKATRVEGKSVVTQEGLSEEIRRRWAECFVPAGASQCGYCSPGIVMKAEALLAKNPEPTRDEISRALLGNLCRCTGYVKIVDAIELAAAARRGEPLPDVDRSGRVGSRTARYRGVELALGDHPFVGDMSVPGMLHGALRFSDHPRARVLRIDTSRAEAHPGVVAVAAAGDVPGERTQGSLTQDWRAARRGRRDDGVRRRRARRRRRRDASRGPRGGGAGRGRVRGARTGHRPVRRACEGRAEAPRARQRPLGLARAARRRRRGARRVRARRQPLVPDAVHRACVPRAGVGARRPRAERAAPRLLAGAGDLGRPAPDRLVPRARRRAGARHAGRDGRRLRREGGPQRPVPRGAARDGHRPSGARHAVAQGEPALPLEAPRDVARLHGRLRRRGPAHRGSRPDRRRHRRVRECRRQGARARGGPRLQRLPRARTSTSRRPPCTRTTRRAARCAASASTSRTSPWRACSTCSPRRSASTAGRSAGATRSTWATASAPGRSSARASA